MIYRYTITIFLQFFQVFGTVLVLLLTVDRLLAVRSGIRYRLICTKQRSLRAITVSFVIVAIYTTPHAIFAKQTGLKTCASVGGSSLPCRIYAVASICINGFIPFCILLICNCVIICKTRKQNTLKIVSWNTQSRRVQDNQLLVILLLVAFVLLLLTLPIYIRYVVFTIIDYETDPRIFATYIFYYHLTQKMAQTNSAVNFLLYCMSGSR